MALETTRRSLITGLIALVAAPAIVRAGNLMPVKVMEESFSLAPVWRVTEYKFSNETWWMARDGLLYRIGESGIELVSGAETAVDNKPA